MSHHSQRSDLTCSSAPVPLGTGVILWRTDIKGHRADVSDYNTDDKTYAVVLRGATTPQSAVVRGLRRSELDPITDESGGIDIDIETPGNETHRRKILSLSRRVDAPGYLRELAGAIDSSNRVSYSLLEDLGEGSPPSMEAVFCAMVYRIKEYYLSSGWHLPIPTPATARILMGMKLLIGEGVTTEPVSFRITTFEDRLAETLDMEEEFNPLILCGALASSLFSSLEEGNPSPESITYEIDALWCAFNGLTDHSASPTVRRAVDELLSDSPGAAGFTHQHVLWCVCCRYIEVCKNLRVHYPDHAGSRSAEQIDRLVRCAKAAIKSRPESPHSFFVSSYLLMDTHLIGRISDARSRYELGCRYAMEGLDAAECSGDPFYMFHCHILVAYWKMTSAYKQPYTLREVLGHVEQADRASDKCLPYTTKFACQRGKHARKYIKEVVKTFFKQNPTYDLDDVWEDQPITLSKIDQAGDAHQTQGHTGSSTIRGMNTGGKLDLYNSQHECVNCGRTTAKLFQCGRCKNVTYCGPQCQKQHWKKGGHKVDCVPKHKQ